MVDPLDKNPNLVQTCFRIFKILIKCFNCDKEDFQSSISLVFKFLINLERFTITAFEMNQSK